MPDPSKPNDPFWFELPPEPPPGSKKLPVDEIEADLKEKILQHEKELHDDLYRLGYIYSRTDRWEQAVGVVQFLLLITRDPDEKAYYCLRMGQCMENLDNFPAAVEFYSQAFAMEPANTETWYYIHNNLGYSLNKLGRHAEAERYCRQAIQIDPKRFNAYKNLGIALQEQGCLAEAASLYIQATRANAGDPRALDHLEELLHNHPQLLKENPLLSEELEKSREATDFANNVIQSILDRYRKEPPEIDDPPSPPPLLN